MWSAMDNYSPSDPGSSDADDDDSAVLLTGLNCRSQHSSSQDESAAEKVSRPLKRKRRSVTWSRLRSFRDGIMSEGEDGGSMSTRLPPKMVPSGSTFPPWAQTLVQNQEGPSVVIAFNQFIDEDGNKQMWCVPLRCVYPASSSPDFDFPRTGTSKSTKLYRQFPLYFSSENLTTQGSRYGRRFSKSKDDQELRYLFAKKIRASQLPIVLSESQNTRQSGVERPLNTGRIPVEIFDQIGEHLSSKDVKQLRLVCKDFEEKVSGSLFHSVVVPFTAEVYGLLSTSKAQAGLTENIVAQDSPLTRPNATDMNGDADEKLKSNLNEKTGQDAKHGVDVFRGFGSHIQRFGMSFEMDQKSLADPPWKAMTEGQSTYWGRYIWPFPDYQRFSKTSRLENAADETTTMKLAFSYLTNVKQIALSVESGLGWMSGPDLSMRARILKDPNPVFTSKRYLPQVEVLGSRKIWSTIEEAYARIGAQDQLKFMELMKDQREEAAELVRANSWREWARINCSVVSETQTQAETKINSTSPRTFRSDSRSISFHPHYPLSYRRVPNGIRPSAGQTALRRYWSRAQRGFASTSTMQESFETMSHQTVQENPLDNETTIGEQADAQPKSQKTQTLAGIIYTKQMKPEDDAQKPREHEIWPKQLRRTQKEWLLETAWAQDAFTSSYLLAVADNQATFSNVTALTISPLSSRYIPKLHRSDFWRALRSLSKVEIIVSADWRDIVKEHNDLLATPSLPPSNAVNSFNVLLTDIISRIASIKSLIFGWKDGGEHAEGLCARNKKILPAPIVPRESMLYPGFEIPGMVAFPNVESITLRNCWLSPDALCGLTATCRNSLKELVLDSVSLTAHPSVPIRRIGAGGAALAGGGAIGGLAGVLFGAAQQPGVAAQTQLQMPANLAGLLQLPGAALTWQQITALPFHQSAVHAYQAGLSVAAAVQHAIRQHNAVISAFGDAYGHGQGPEPGLGYIATAQGDQIEAQLQVHLHRLNLYQIQLNSLQQAQAMQAPIYRRRGCWPEVIERIRETSVDANGPKLRISFLSCGHVKLRSATFDQSALEQAYELSNESSHRSAFFTKRRAALKDLMLASTDVYLARIVSAIPEAEMLELQTQWGMEHGWPSPELAGSEYDNDDGWGKWGYRTAFASAMDGQPYGGTGRFSGVINGFQLLKKEE